MFSVSSEPKTLFHGWQHASIHLSLPMQKDTYSFYSIEILVVEICFLSPKLVKKEVVSV